MVVVTVQFGFQRILLVFTAIFYILGVVFKRMKFLHRLIGGTTQIGIRAIFALIILLVALAEGVGEYILGAFLGWCGCILTETR